MIKIPNYIVLFGDEDCDVQAFCEHPTYRCNMIAEYGNYKPGEYPNTFPRNDVTGFLNAIIEHCATHE